MEAISTPDLVEMMKNSNKLIGLRQVAKALNHESSIIRCVVVAGDAEQQIKDMIMDLINKINVQSYLYVSKKELGLLCGIKVNCAVLGLTEKLSK